MKAYKNIHSIRGSLLFFMGIAIFLFLGSPSSFSEKSSNSELSQLTSADFTGTIGTIPIVMHLNIKEKSDNLIVYSGYYYYTKIGVNIPVTGKWFYSPGSGRKIELRETVNGNATGYFSLLPVSKRNYSSMSGTWSGNGKRLTVRLTQY